MNDDEVTLNEVSARSNSADSPDRVQAYLFETTKWTKRIVEDNDPSLQIFIGRLDIHEEVVDACDYELKDFTRHVIHNINWYHKSIEAEQHRRKQFFVLTLVLAVFLSVAAAVIGVIFSEVSGLGYGLVAALLSGILGIQRSMSTWFKHRKVGTVFADAAAQLKEILYAFEDRWMGHFGVERARIHVLLDADGDAFLDDLRESTQRARRIASAERTQYYLVSAPTVALPQKLPTVAASSPPTPELDRPAGSRFRFKRGAFTEDEISTILENHATGSACIETCTHLENEHKARLRERYDKTIYHYPISTADVYAEAITGGISIGINNELLLAQPPREIAQTLIHEMMHCAGYEHPLKTEADQPGDAGAYYSSPPLLAEMCVAGVQSDRADKSRPPSLACSGGFDHCQVRSELSNAVDA